MTQDKSVKEFKPWIPPLGPTQEKIFWDPAPYILCHGERGSGKSIGALHKLVRHVYRFRNALAFVCTLTRAGSNAGGAWEDLINPEWDEVNNMPAGVLNIWHEGIGLEWGNFKKGKRLQGETYSDMSKVLWIDVVNQYGGISRIMQMSMPVASFIKDRIKNYKPSFFLFEELTNTYDQDYFVKPIQQLGRRRTVPAKEQQYIATCNPADEGEKHWTYKTFFVYPKEVDPITGEIKENKDYSVHHVPMIENKWLEDKEGYRQKVMQECKSDPTAYDRLILGKWVAKVSGRGIFEGYYHPQIHVKGKIGVNGLAPIPGEPIIVGYDPGDVNNARVLMQKNKVAGSKKEIWRVFDEVVNIDSKLSFRVLVMDLLDRMAFWNERDDCLYPYIHIGDMAAMTHFNPHGSFDYLQFEKISAELIEEIPRFKDLTPIRMLAPEKGKGSVDDRVKAVQNLLVTEQIYVSAMCNYVSEMFRNLKKAKKNKVEQDYKPLKTIRGEIHVFDAISYPIYFYESGNETEHDHEPKKNLDIVSF